MVALWSPTEPSTTGSAPQNVQWRHQAYAAPHNEKVEIHTEMRFLRFQAPWAYGRKLFALLRRASVENWANVCYRLMDVAERKCVRGESEFPKRPDYHEERCSHMARWGLEALLSTSVASSGRFF